MHKIVACLVLLLLPVAASAQSQLDIEKGSVDLLKSEALSMPFTIFDQLLYSLKKEADEKANNLRPEKNDFRPSKTSLLNASVSYSKKMSRVGVLFMIFVSGMDDPWREVCKRHVYYMASYLGVPGLGLQKDSPIKESVVKSFVSRHLGPRASFDDELVNSLQPFLDAMVITVQFNVESGEKLTHLRRCDLDIKTNRLTYFEHNY